MSLPAKLNLTIQQGGTFTQSIQYASGTVTFKNISAATAAAPVVITTVAHGITQSTWPMSVHDVAGMRKLNAANNPPIYDSDIVVGTIIGSTQISLPIDGRGYSAYTSNGVIRFPLPADMTGWTARMQIRETVDATTTLVDLTTANGGVTIDTTQNMIALLITATATALLDFSTGVYDLELITGTGAVIKHLYGNVTLVKEVTR